MNKGRVFQRLVIFLTLALFAVLTLTGCSGGVIAPPLPTDSPPPGSSPLPTHPPAATPAPLPQTGVTYEDQLVIQYGWSKNEVVRWKDGYVDVYDTTGYPFLSQVLEQWNEIIGGTVIFRLSSNPASPVRVAYDNTLSFYGYCGITKVAFKGTAVAEAEILINPFDLVCPLQSTFLHEFGHVVGFAGHTTDGGVMDAYNTGSTEITPTVEVMLKRLYELPVGYSWNPVGRELGEVLWETTKYF